MSVSSTKNNSFSAPVLNIGSEKPGEKTIIKIDDPSELQNLVAVSAKTINDIYKEFDPSKPFNLESLNKCINELDNIETCYKKLLPLKEESAKSLKKDLDVALRQVQEMNMHSPVVTKQDIVGPIKAFFVEPLEGDYLCPENGQIYVQPNHSELLKFGGHFFINGEYTGIGLLKHQMFGGRLCDILYLEKKQDQIEYEFPGIVSQVKNSLGSYFSINSGSSIKVRIQKQDDLQIKAINFINAKLSDWRYEGFEICGYNQLLAKGIDEEYAQKNHAILFFYKQKLKGFISSKGIN